MKRPFAVSSKTRYEPGDKLGLIYTDEEYAEGIGGVNHRETGFIPGNVLSALTINTALRQYTSMYYVLMRCLGNLLGLTEADANDTRVNNISSQFISFLDNINKFINETNNVPVNKCMYAGESDSPITPALTSNIYDSQVYLYNLVNNDFISELKSNVERNLDTSWDVRCKYFAGDTNNQSLSSHFNWIEYLLGKLSIFGPES